MLLVGRWGGRYHHYRIKKSLLWSYNIVWIHNPGQEKYKEEQYYIRESIVCLTRNVSYLSRNVMLSTCTLILCLNPCASFADRFHWIVQFFNDEVAKAGAFVSNTTNLAFPCIAQLLYLPSHSGLVENVKLCVLNALRSLLMKNSRRWDSNPKPLGK